MFFLIYGGLVHVLNLFFFFETRIFSVTEIGFFGTAVVILLGFRNNEAYRRYWEARTAWGDLTNASRYFASEVMGYIQPPRDKERAAQDSAVQDSAVQDATVQEAEGIHSELIYRHLAFLNALRLQLRKEETWEELKPFLADSEFQALGKAANKATLLNHRQALRLKELYRSGWIKQPTYIFGLMETVKEFFAAQGRCERIKNTPLPRQYAFFTKSFVWIFVLLLPFALIQHLGWTAIPIYVVLAAVFTVTERIGSRTEDPFELKMEDIAMSSICRNIEIDLRQQLGEASVPAPLEPTDGILM